MSDPEIKKVVTDAKELLRENRMVLAKNKARRQQVQERIRKA